MPATAARRTPPAAGADTAPRQPKKGTESGRARGADSRRADKRPGTKPKSTAAKSTETRKPQGDQAKSDAGPSETGTVKWFNASKGFGFIIRENGEEIFVHHRSILGDGRRSLRDGGAVSFHVVTTDKGPQAEDVSALDWTMAGVPSHRFRGVTLPTSSHPAIRRAKRRHEAPAIHGNKLWKSSCLIIDYLHKHPEPAPRRVLDAGCGWGIGGIWCAKRFGAAVTSVDADPNVFPFLGVTAELNGVETEARVSRFEKLSTRYLENFDTLIAADVCFWDELVSPVANMVNRALRAGVQRIIIADPERPTFHEMAARCVERHGGEVLNWRTRGSLAASGALLVINNY